VPDDRRDINESRRAVLKIGASIGVGLCFRSATAAGQGDAAASMPKPGDVLIKADDASKTPLKPADIPLGAKQTLAWAMDPKDGTVRSGSRLNQVMLLRFAPEALSAETRARSADGVVAYTAICTHNGCDIDDWLANEQILSCACHDSRFDPRDGAKVVDGPAPRELPALPLTIADGTLVVSKPFTTRVGFDPG